jgi:hypothetical protein
MRANVHDQLALPIEASIGKRDGWEKVLELQRAYEL